MNPNILIITFLAASAFSMIIKSEKNLRLGNLALSLLGGIMMIFSAWPFVFSGVQYKLISDWWLVDSFSGLMMMLIACIYVFAIIISVRYIGHEYKEKIITLAQYKLYFVLFQLFALCMFLVVTTNNSLLLWLTLEGTTLTSTFLVGLYRKKTSIEAAWKYMILCSTGISLGLIGILLLSYGAHTSGIDKESIFILNHLAERAQSIPENIVKLAFVFLFIGFGTKVGLAPMHTWLPDAHSKAPSPISAIFSAVLLNVALFAILRFKFIVDSAFSDSGWTDNLFLIFGFFSIILAALMMLIQTNYKRMLAYSSIEHMGIIVFCLGLSPLGALAGVMHMIGHTFAKSTLFFGAGEILIRWKTTKIDKIKNMFREAKYTSILFILGIIAIIAIPPSALFVSEYGMFVQAIAIHPVLSVVLLVALSIIAYAMLALTIKMIFSVEENGGKTEFKKEKWNITHSVMVLELVMIIFFAWWFTTDGAADVLGNIAKTFLFVK